MPKSARNKVVSLAKTAKKGRENKELLVEQLREAMDKYAYIYVLDVQNMRNLFLKEIRQAWQGSKIIFGRTKVMQKVLGKSAEDEYLDNSHELAAIVRGDVGLLFTDEPLQVVEEYFDSFVKSDFARAGLQSPLTFTLPEGVVYSTGGQQPAEDDVPLPHSLESELRGLGLPTRLDKGKIVLGAPFTVCKEGQTLDSKQARLLKQFGVACAQFKVSVLGYYSKTDSSTHIV